MATQAASAQPSLDVARIREDFPILNRMVYGKPLVYLDNAATSQKPRSVIESLVDYYENYNANVHRGVHSLSMEATDAMEAARTKVAKFVGAETDECIIWTRNATESLNLVAHTWARAHVHEGDEIVTTPMEHHSNLVPWQELAIAKGAKLRFLPMTDEGTLDLTAVDSVISKRTKLVAVTQASNSLGTINPVEELAQAAHAHGAKILVDGAQSAPHMPVNVQDLGVDFFAFSGHKMMGPTGIGALYTKREILDEMEPLLTGGEMVLQVTYEKASWADLPMRFEAGTPNIADAIAFGVATDYLNNLGMDNVRKHEESLTEYALERFSQIKEFTVFGPRSVELRGGIISFHNENLHPHDLGTYLDRQGIAIRTGHHCTMPLMGKLGVPATARASLYVYNTEAEIDCLIEAINGALRYFRNGS